MNNKRIIGIITIVIGAIVVVKTLPMLLSLAGNLIGISLVVILALFVLYVITNFLKKDTE